MKHVNRKNKDLSYVSLVMIACLFSLAIIILFSGNVSAEGDYALFIDEKGNVGIGTNNPTTTLDVNGTIKAKKFNGYGTIPIGGIIMWSGTKIPPGWRLCDGSNGTPDLRGRFVLSSGAGEGLTPRNIGEQGGEEMHKLTIDEMPKHKHTWDGVSADEQDDYGFGRSEKNVHRDDGFSVDDICQEQGKDKPHNNMPPFYVLAFIMREK